MALIGGYRILTNDREGLIKNIDIDCRAYGNFSGLKILNI